jgi:hypothetical protein
MNTLNSVSNKSGAIHTELEPRLSTAKYDISRVKVEKPLCISASDIERRFVLSLIPSKERHWRLRNFVYVLIYAP